MGLCSLCWLCQAINSLAVLRSVSVQVHPHFCHRCRCHRHRLGDSMLLGGPDGLSAHSQVMGSTDSGALHRYERLLLWLANTKHRHRFHNPLYVF